MRARPRASRAPRVSPAPPDPCATVGVTTLHEIH